MMHDPLGSSHHSRGSDGSLSRSPLPYRVDEELAEDEDEDLQDNIKDEIEMLQNEDLYATDQENDRSSTSSRSDNSTSPIGNGLPKWSNSSNSSNSDEYLSHPQSYIAHPYRSPIKRSSSGQSSTSSPSFLLQGGFFYLAFCLCAMTAMYTSRATLATTLDQVALLDANRVAMDAQLQNTERGLLRIKRQVQAIDAMRHSYEHGDNGMAQSNFHRSVDQISDAENRRRQENTRALKELQGLQNRIKDGTLLVDRLKQQVRDTAKRDLVAKYGKGPHRVEIELVFPDRKVGGVNKFVIEMADFEVMPHSVYTFLEMVSLKLLNGCSFILNALHVVKAAPLPYDGSSAAQKAKEFSQAGLESVAFKEYSPEYPHLQHTVGFAADGSPSFFINTENNADVHAGDPCFGRIVSGLEAVKRLESQPTRNGIWFEKRIGIKAARILQG